MAVRAMADVLYQRLIDLCWDELEAVFERPEVQEAEATIMRAIAEAFVPKRRAPNSERRSPRARG
jgi:hypothetical protein